MFLQKDALHFLRACWKVGVISHPIKRLPFRYGLHLDERRRILFLNG